MTTITNPIVPGWYADPEARYYEGQYWIYVTRSFTAYTDQMNLDAFSSADLTHWTKHEGIVQMEDFPHIYRAVWAPTIIEKDGRYYLIFASNDIQSDDAVGGLEIAVADRPQGPFVRHIGGILVDKFHNKAQPIDAHLFKDDDGTIYLYYGGWSHCNVAVLNDTLTGFVPHADGSIFKEITPPHYVEGPCMLKKDGVYYFMWSSGNWTDGTYCVQYCPSASPFGPFDTATTVLQAGAIAEGPGHHGYLYHKESGQWLIVYHRRIIGDTAAGHRVLCIDKMHIAGGKIDAIAMTNSWVIG